MRGKIQSRELRGFIGPVVNGFSAFVISVCSYPHLIGCGETVR